MSIDLTSRRSFPLFHQGIIKDQGRLFFYGGRLWLHLWSRIFHFCGCKREVRRYLCG